jgi:hypothetical protein
MTKKVARIIHNIATTTTSTFILGFTAAKTPLSAVLVGLAVMATF